MRRLILPLMMLLVSCAGAPKDGINSPMHAVGNLQAGWAEHKANDGELVFVVKSIGSEPYDALLRVAVQHARKSCPYGYRVMGINGADQPMVDILNPRMIIGSELRFEVQCFDRENL